MTQRGGPAAINGFLHQILNHLDWMTDVRLSGTLDGDAVKNGLLILEPGVNRHRTSTPLSARNIDPFAVIRPGAAHSLFNTAAEGHLFLKRKVSRSVGSATACLPSPLSNGRRASTARTGPDLRDMSDAEPFLRKSSAMLPADPRRRGLDRVPGEMRIPRGGPDPAVAEQLRDRRQALAERQSVAGKAVAQVMYFSDVASWLRMASDAAYSTLY